VVRYLFDMTQDDICRYHEFQGNTNDCGPFAIAMAVSLFRGLPHYVEGKAVAHWMNRYPLLARIPGWATFPWGVAWFVRRKFDIHARLSVLTSEESLFENLERGRITIVAMGWRVHHWLMQGHFALLYGRDDEAVVFLNSADVNCLTRMSTEEFRKKWRFLGRIMITIGG
jgi:hypothetical protein